jgi:ATP phosphoribosyltransferase
VLTVAVQKSGRLTQRTLALLGDAGIEFANGSPAKLKSRARGFPLEALFLRDDDIPGCVARGIADVGIVGENVCAEQDLEVEVVEKLGYGQCRLALAVPRDSSFDTVESLEGRGIATSYPSILERFLQERGVSASIRPIRGSAELAPSIGWADAIFDIVSTGSTLISNGLRELYEVMRSEALLVASPALEESKRTLLDRLLFRLRAVLNAKDYKYILLNCPNESLDRVAEALPGIKSPTVMPLAIEGWSSVHTVIRETEFWEILESLQGAGAEGILVLPIQKMIL